MYDFRKKPKALPLRPIELKDAGSNYFPKEGKDESEERKILNAIHERAGDDISPVPRIYQILLIIFLFILVIGAFIVGFILFKDELL